MNNCKKSCEIENIDELLRNKNINFLIGSGASVPLFKTLKINKKNYSLEDLLSSEELSETGTKLVYFYYFKEWIQNMAKLSKDLIDDKDGSEKKSETVSNYELFIEHLYHFMLNESNEKPKRINIFTTNYDLLFEETFDKVGRRYPLCAFNDGSNGFFTKIISNQNYFRNITQSGYNDNYKCEIPMINLLKMHGSVSWKISDDSHNLGQIEVDYNMPIINEILISLKDNKDDNLVSSIHQTLLKERKECVDEINELANRHKHWLDNFYKEYIKLPIVNPTKKKFNETVSEQYYYQMIRNFSYELEKEQTVLIVFGFSFADEHITDIFKRSLLNPELEVIIIAYSNDVKSELKEKFGDQSNIKYYPMNIYDEKDNSNGETGDFDYLLKLLGANQND